MRKKRGYTLIEVIVALGLVAAGTLAFGAMVPMSARSSRMNANYQQAVSLLQHKIDQCRAVGWGRLTYSELHNAGIIDDSPTTSPFNFATVDTLTSIYPACTGTIQVSDYSSVIRQVTVTLTWTGSPVRQGNGTLTATALIAKE
jgi:prepilin-type N-terminal cleavage/methylation domain-containing protein